MRVCLSFILLLLILAPSFGYSENTLPPIVASLELDRREAFVKEQIQVTLRVGYPPGAFGMTQSKLQVSNAELFSLHKTEVVENYQGLSYRFIETSYALFGNAKGLVNLSGITINATLPVSAGEGGTNPTLQAVIDPQSVSVREMPLQDTLVAGKWLAASQVTISSEWPVFEGSLNPGMPLTRHIVVKVSGQHPAAVSGEFLDSLPDGLRAYPGPSITTIDKTPEGLNGSVTLPVTLVASKAGKYVLPELTVPWWDIDGRQWRVAILPARDLDIVDADAAGLVTNYKRGLMLLGLLIVSLCFVCFRLWRRPLTVRQTRELVISEKSAWKRLKKSVATGGDTEIRQAILAWSNCHGPAELSAGLDPFCQRFPQLKEFFCTLEKRLYAKDTSVELDRQRLGRVLADVRNKALREGRKVSVKNNLYPESIGSR